MNRCEENVETAFTIFSHGLLFLITHFEEVFSLYYIFRGILNDSPVRWFLGKQPIYAKGDRIYVTTAQILMIEDLGLSDSNLYR